MFCGQPRMSSVFSLSFFDSRTVRTWVMKMLLLMLGILTITHKGLYAHRDPWMPSSTLARICSHSLADDSISEWGFQSVMCNGISAVAVAVSFIALGLGRVSKTFIMRVVFISACVDMYQCIKQVTIVFHYIWSAPLVCICKVGKWSDFRRLCIEW